MEDAHNGLCPLFTRVLALLFVAMLPSAAQPSVRAPHFSSCNVGGTDLKAHCGKVDVYENRSLRAGRTISLDVIEIDARQRTNRAVFWNPGGPGAADSSNVPAIASGQAAAELMKLHDTYDLVFVDNRGTGLSHEIRCDLYSTRHPEYYFAQIFPDEPLRACRAARSKDTDLSMYTTDISADDLDDVRAALHYPQIVLDGGSYGTMLFLDYARRHPAHVESVVLSGVAPPGFYFIPLADAQAARTAMNDLIADCARDSTCNLHFPDLAAHFAALVRRFDRGPISVRIRNALGHEQTVSLSKEVFADQLRHTLYASEAAAYVPYIVDQAYRANYAPLAELVETATRFFGRGLSTGLNLSVTCAEDLPFITEAQIVRASAGSFQGDTRVRAQQRACAIWNVRRASPSFAQPVRSRAPILMISGAEDPVTPPSYGRDALRYLPNGRQLVIPYTGHDSESACTDALVVAFVRTRNAKALDASKCIGSSRRPPFATSMKGFGG
jgi:pimeloyl-ACP methyl ester carboxylesterase